MRNDLGARLRQIRASRNQQEMADVMGVAKRTYASYERNERVPDALMLAPLVEEGWSGDWLLTGRGSERAEPLHHNALREDPAPYGQPSQPLRSADITLAVQLAEEALEGKRLGPKDYGQLVNLIHGALVSGLPSAQVLAFARPAARGIRGSGSGDLGTSGSAAAG